MSKIINTNLRLTEEGVEFLIFQNKSLHVSRNSEIKERICKKTLSLLKTIPRYRTYFSTGGVCKLNGTNVACCGGDIGLYLSPYILKLSENWKEEKLYNKDSKNFCWGELYEITPRLLMNKNIMRSIDLPCSILIAGKYYRLPGAIIPSELFNLGSPKKFCPKIRDILWEGDLGILREIQQLFKEFFKNLIETEIESLKFSEFIVNCSEEELKHYYPEMHKYYLKEVYPKKKYRRPDPGGKTDKSTSGNLTVDEIQQRLENFKSRIKIIP